MTQEKVHTENKNPHCKPQMFTIPQIPANLENFSLNVSKRNSEREEEVYSRYLRNRHPNSGGFRPEHSFQNQSQFDPNSKMTDFLVDTYDEKRDETFPEYQVIQTNVIPKYLPSYLQSMDLRQTSNKSNALLSNFPGNSHRNNEYLNDDSFKNYSDINVLKIPETSTLAYKSSASGAINYQQTLSSTEYPEDILITTIEGIFVSEHLSTTNRFWGLNGNSSNLYISPDNLEYTESSPYKYMNNKSQNVNTSPELRNTVYSPHDDWASKKLTYKKAIPSTSGVNGQNDAIEISIKIPESILRQLANEVILGRNNERLRQAPGMISQVSSTNLLKNVPSLIGPEKILKSSDNKTKDFKIGETMVDHISEYMTDKDIDDVKIRRNFQKEIVASNKSSTFDNGQEHMNSDLPTSTDLLNHKHIIFPNNSLQRKYLANIDESAPSESSTRNSITEAHVLKNQSSDVLNNATSNENIVSKANAKGKKKKSHKSLLKNKKFSGNQKVLSEKYLMSNKNLKNGKWEKMPFSPVEIDNVKRTEETDNKAQMNRRSFHLNHKNRHRKHKRRLRKSGRNHRMKIKKHEYLGNIRKRSTTTTNNKYKFNEQSTQPVSFERNNVNLKIAPELFLDWIVSSSKDFNKPPEPVGSNYNDVPLNLSLLTDTKNMNLEVPNDLSLVNYEETSHDNSHATSAVSQNYDDVHKIQNKKALELKKKLEFERNIDIHSKSNKNHFSDELLQNLTGPEVNALLFGNTSLDTFLDAFYKVSRNITTVSPAVLHKYHRRTTTTKSMGAKLKTTTTKKIGADRQIITTKKHRINLRTTTTQKQRTDFRATTTKKQHRHFRTTVAHKQHTDFRSTTTKKQNKHFRTTIIKKQHVNQRTNTTKKQRTNPPEIMFHKKTPKKNSKLSKEQIKDHHHNASQENTKKKSEGRKKLHKLTQNLKKVVWKYVNRHTNDESKKKLMYQAALKKLPSILKKHIKIQT
ncbi:hypothetical protein HNY73_015866 [Argiope bruennichi]|uniref:Uncharacterized protein n=1 Tax=Argiope bruennichi TaxID=94029 RepID=A0A8T0EKF2_ARGBR|nr:hypothetical protein HNY73_015866 [Argiope bruennichi]